MNVAKLLEAKKFKTVMGIGPHATLRETARHLVDLKLGALVVTDDTRKLLGIVSERDLVPVVASDDPLAAEQTVSSVMTRSVISCTPGDEVAFILQTMNEHAIRHIPVMENDKLVAMLSIRELTKAYELLQIEANTDPLTQVSNRRPFLKTLEAAFDAASANKNPTISSPFA